MYLISLDEITKQITENKERNFSKNLPKNLKKVGLEKNEAGNWRRARATVTLEFLPLPIAPHFTPHFFNHKNISAAILSGLDC